MITNFLTALSIGKADQAEAQKEKERHVGRSEADSGIVSQFFPYLFVLQHNADRNKCKTSTLL